MAKQNKNYSIAFRNATKTAMLCTLSVSLSALAEESKPEKMSTILVESSKGKKGYVDTETSLPLYSRPLNETPQTISVISKELIKDQGITTTRDSLRNVAGISLAAGEASAGQGDNLTIRGFTARSDFFMDGMRDFGAYTRDPFNIEKIDVIKGPSSFGFGRGSTGGAINQESKTAKAEKITDAQLTVGTDMTKRATIDVNRKLKNIKNAAFRINAFSHNNQVAGRDVAENSRSGFAPTISLGIGSATRTTLSYLHQTENNVPDYGLPWVGNRPAGRQDTIRDAYFGFRNGSNFFKADIDMITTKLEHDISDHITFREQVRLARNQRNIRVTEPKVATPSTITATRNQIAIQSTEDMLDSQTSVQAKFNTGAIKHDLITGIELIREKSTPKRENFTGVPDANLANPNSYQVFSGTATIIGDVNTITETEALYLNDTISPHKKIDIILGGRFDRFGVTYKDYATNSYFSRTDLMSSVRSSFVYKPLENSSIYANYGTSYNPSAESFALTVATQGVSPEKSETYEVGTKWGFFKNKLNTMLAVFQTTKTKARTTDPNNFLLNILGGKQRVRGTEFQINGEITEKLQIFASYAYMDSEVLKSTVGNTVGNALANVPTHTLNLWGSYKITSKLEVGAGANAVSRRAASISAFDANGNALTGAAGSTPGAVKYAPGYITFNAMTRYEVTPSVNMQLNIYNLTNQFYYDQIHPSHIVPGAGRYALLTTSIKFD